MLPHSFLPTEKIDPAWLWLIDVPAKGVALFALALVISLALSRTRCSASLRHFVLLLAITASLALPLAGLILPSWTIQPAPASALVSTEPNAPAVKPIAMAELSAAVAFGSFEEASELPLEPRSEIAPQQASEFPLSWPAPARARAFDWRIVVVGIWSAGFLAALAPMLIGLARLRHWRRSSVAAPAIEHRSLCQQLCRRLGIARRVELLMSSDHQLPMAWGLRRPVVLLPTDAAEWPLDRVQAVLLHELAHVQRHDFLTQLLAQFARALYWYNPLAWLAVYRLRREQEQACDDRVLGAGVPAVEYADHLLAIVSRRVSRKMIPAVALAMAHGSQIEQRLFSILDSRRRRTGLRPTTAVFVAGMTCLLALPIVTATLRADESDTAEQPQAQPAAAIAQAETKPVAEKAADESASQRRLAERVTQLRQALREHSITPPSDEQVINGAIQGVMGSLADPYSEFLPADKLSDLQRNIEGKLTGIGAQLETRGKEIVVVTPLDGSPALAAGIRPGDAIVEIDGKSTDGLELSAAVKRIVGASGSVVKLKVRRADDKMDELAITRGPIVLRAVRSFSRDEHGQWNYLLDRERQIGYVTVDQFTKGTPEELRSAIESLKRDGLKGLILDLRSAPGGLLDAAVESAELFLPAATIVTLRGRESGEHTFKSDGKKQLGEFPLMVLIDEHTASAAEVFAGALQDNDRAVLLGTRTFGKGSVQTLIPLEADGAIRLTTAYYYLPSGRNIDRKPGQANWGIDPNDGYFVPISREDAEARGQRRQQRALLGQANATKKSDDPFTPESIVKNEHDPQLAAAVTSLRAKIDDGEFAKVGQSTAAAAQYAISRDQLERRRATLLKDLETLDRELSAIGKAGP
jgi:carboxyl-terminal processing protease